MKHIKLFEDFNNDISNDLKYHIDNDISLLENVFRTGSEKFFSVINETRALYEAGKIDLSAENKDIVNSDLGKKGIYEGEEVYLDLPMINEAEYKGKKVELNKPKRNSGSGKKYYVYVNNAKGNVIKVSFGDAKGGLSAKVSDPKARAAFAARHDCKNKKDKTKAGYWACRSNKYANLWGGKTYPGYW